MEAWFEERGLSEILSRSQFEQAFAASFGATESSRREAPARPVESEALAGPPVARPKRHLQVTQPKRGPAQRGKPGRKPGSGAIQDEPHLLQMLDLLVNGAARNVHDAAQQVSNGIQSAADRLRKNFRSSVKGPNHLPEKLGQILGTN